MQILIFLLGVFTSTLIGAQFNAYIPLPACWGVWGIIVLIGLLSIMIKCSRRKETEQIEEDEQK